MRIVRTPDGPLAPDPTGRANGRGAYLCNRVACWDGGLAKRALGRSLRVQVSDANLEALQNYYIEIIRADGGNLQIGEAAEQPSEARH